MPDLNSIERGLQTFLPGVTAGSAGLGGWLKILNEPLLRFGRGPRRCPKLLDLGDLGRINVCREKCSARRTSSTHCSFPFRELLLFRLLGLFSRQLPL